MEGKQVIGRANLRGRMSLESHAGICLRHPFAIIDHLNQRTSRIHDVHPNHRGTCVNRILHQFLDHGGGTLYHLARRNLVGDMIG